MADARKGHKMAAENKVGFLWHGKGSQFCHLLTKQGSASLEILFVSNPLGVCEPIANKKQFTDGEIIPSLS